LLIASDALGAVHRWRRTAKSCVAAALPNGIIAFTIAPAVSGGARDNSGAAGRTLPSSIAVARAIGGVACAVTAAYRRSFAWLGAAAAGCVPRVAIGGGAYTFTCRRVACAVAAAEIVLRVTNAFVSKIDGVAI